MENKSSSTIIQNTYPVKGLSCASCAISVESILKSKQGVKEVTVNFASKNAVVTFDSSQTNSEELKKAVQAVGYDIDISAREEDDSAEMSHEHAHHHEEIESSTLKRNTLGAFLLSLPVFIIGMFMHSSAGFELHLVSFFLTGIVLFWFGKLFFISAFKKAKHLQTNMDTLVALSTLVAFLFSSFNMFFPKVLSSHGIEPFIYFESAAVIITFILLGKLIEKKATDRAFTSIKGLMELQGKTAILLKNGKEIETPIKELRSGDLISVRPGEKIPVDGRITDGNTFINESMITGEAVPVYKEEKDNVMAGTINTNGSVTIQIEKLGKETILGQIIKSVQKAQDSKAPVQKLVDKVAGIFVPVVIVIAILTFLGWIIIGGFDKFPQAINSCVTVLIIACPCALGLATPIAITVGVGRAAKEGILIKDAQSLEVAHKVTTVVLDKTGTLTVGKPTVKTMYWKEGLNIDKLESILYALEKKSEHPLAKAVVKELEKKNLPSVAANNFRNVPGKGIYGVVDDAIYYIGNKASLVSSVIVPEELQRVESSEQGNSLVYFANDKEVLALIILSDAIKDNSFEAIQHLKYAGKDIHLLTGDNEATAQKVGKELGIVNYKSGVLPADKLNYIQSLQEKGKVVAMVGDGINDSEALAKADVGIAMASGTDIAMDIASITLMNSDPVSIFRSIKISAATMKVVKQNLFWAFIYNIIGIPLATGILIPFLGWHLSPMLAGAAMAFSSVSVVLNSLRLKFI